jgi:hypothetical protein
MNIRVAAAGRAVLSLALTIGLVSPPLAAQSKSAKAPQRIDDEYTQTIRQNLQDPRITTELVDHLPASDTIDLIVVSSARCRASAWR